MADSVIKMLLGTCSISHLKHFSGPHMYPEAISCHDKHVLSLSYPKKGLVVRHFKVSSDNLISLGFSLTRIAFNTLHFIESGNW